MNADTQAAIDRKRLATLTARCALKAITLYPSRDDHGRRCYVASRWAWTREFSALDEVEQWLGRIEGRRP